MQENPISAADIFALIGHEGFARLVAGFYKRVATDDILRPMYPEEDLEPAARRLQLFLEQYFGGPTTYLQERGHPRLRARHMPFAIDQNARDRWLEHMLAALNEANFDAQVQHIMEEYLQNAATFLINRPHHAGGMFTVKPNNEGQG